MAIPRLVEAAAATKQLPVRHCATSPLFALFVFIVLTPFNQCQDPGLVLTQPEEQPIGSFVGSVSNHLKLYNLVREEDMSSLKYSIFSDSKINIDFFNIDALSGNISFAKRLDREAVCLYTLCEINFLVAVSGNKTFLTIPVKINITDLNDNSPSFPSPGVMSVHFSEAAAVNFSQVLTSASDADSSFEFGVKSYFLEPGSDQFAVVVTRNFVGTSQVSLVLKEKLDREMLDSYRLKVVAKDGGNPSRSGTLTVNVAVDDVNDNDPTFSEKEYYANFSEEAGPGYTVTIVTATDRDIHDNGKVIYELNSVLSSNSVDVQDKIMIDNITGAVILRQPLVSGDYRFLIDAHDLGIPPRSDQAVVSVSVLDTINNQPIVSMNLFPIDNLPFGYVSERSEVSTVVAVLSVEDPDSGDNGTVTCDCLEPNFQLQILEENRYKLMTTKPLDREISARYTIKVICRDKGSPSLNGTANITLNVLDINDNSPVFDHTSYVQTIAENNKNDSTVLVVSASDKDDGENAVIEYKLENGVEEFRIMPLSGIIKANRRFDREEKDQYIFHVLAVDHGDRQLTGTATVTVNILDVNDVHPKFSQASYHFKMYENRDAGSIVGNVTVRDPDLGDGGNITLSLKPLIANEDVPFVINSLGRINSRCKFDREEKDEYKFYIVATDQGMQKLTSSVEVAVEILDVNDIPPQFLFPSDGNFTVYTSLPIKEDIPILQVKVYDGDSSQNSFLTYEMVANNASDLFRIGQVTGEVFANRYLGVSETGTYLLTINVTDHGVPALWDVRTVYLVLQSKSGPDNDAIWELHVLIVACIVCFTVIVSGVVLVAICVVRKQDRERSLQNKLSYFPDKCANSHVVMGDKQRREKVGRSLKDQSPRHDISYHQQHQQTQHTFSNNSPINTTTGNTRSFNQGCLLVEIPERRPRPVIQPKHETHDAYHSTSLAKPETHEAYHGTSLIKSQKHEDYSSTSSAETVTGDSGHGTDEDMSHTLEQANTPVSVMGPGGLADFPNLWNQTKSDLANPALPVVQHHRVQPRQTSTRPHIFIDNRSAIFEPRSAHMHTRKHLPKNQTHKPTNSGHFTERPATTKSIIKNHQLQSSFSQYDKQRQITTMSPYLYKSSYPALPRSQRQTSFLSQYSLGDDDTDISDPNTTTSGSYCVTPEDVDSVYNASRDRVKDIYV